MILREDYVREVERIKSALKKAEIMLETFDRTSADENGSRFFGKRPKQAMDILFRERGHGMTEEELTRLVIEGGVTIGKKRDQMSANNVRISIERQLAKGTLIRKGNLLIPKKWKDDESRWL